MSYPAWPLTLPQCVMADGFSNGGEPALRRQQMEAGLDRVTRISSTTVRNNTYSVLLDSEQLPEFWSFYDGPANAGADKVLMPMFTANKTLLHLCRFTSYPSVSRHGIKWRVTFSLETDQQQISWS